MSEVKYGGLPYTQAMRFLQKKSNLKTRHWDDLNTGAHIKSFTVAGALNDNLLSDMRGAVQSYLDQGKTITHFRKDFDRIVKKYGWNYTGKRGWRTRIIYDTNLRTAHAAGKWHKIQETKKERPYLKYITVGDDRVRDEHQSWDGLILPVDDLFWDTHYPPNGWGCRCTVRTLSKSQAKKAGISRRPKIEKTERINTHSGEVYGDMPKGIDTGWDYNVGREDVYANSADVFRGVDKRVGQALLSKLVTNQNVLTGWLTKPNTAFLPVAKLPNDIQTTLKSDNDLLLLSNDTIRKQIKTHGDLTSNDFAKIGVVLDKGVVLKDRGAALTVLHDGYVLGFKKTRANENLLDTFYKIDSKKAGKRIERAIKKGKVVR